MKYSNTLLNKGPNKLQLFLVFYHGDFIYIVLVFFNSTPPHFGFHRFQVDDKFCKILPMQNFKQILF